ncbi:MAG: NAD-binding protein [Candidatus Marinimicrobia bacterium]|nr:NAD-binding protein [Candidatus Neomarinimicrobiota bacterium]
MRRWFRLLIRNSFFQVGMGIFMVMILGGLILRSLETGAITEGETPFWWAIVTMTTVGYGDYAPSTSEGRIFAVLVMFAGISLTAMFTAVISSIFVAKRIREDKGLEKVNVKSHIILCGWNRNADKIIDSIQYLSEGRRKDLVLINDLDEESIARLKTRYRDIQLYFVAGDYTSEQILQRASLEEADTIIIIPSDVDATIQNPDEKTILATLTIKGLEPNKRLIAYLYSRDNLTHIKRANADEVVISDDFGAYMLASHVVDPGIPQTLNRLMDNVSENRFKRVDIPSEFVGQSFDNLFNHFRNNNGSLLIGVFSEEENLGIGEVLSADSSALDAFIERKLKEGGVSLQEESKISTVINPDRNYIIKDGERAIIIP